MNFLKKIVIAASLLIITSALAQSIKAADESDWPTSITFTEPVRVGDMVLSPGQYEFRLVHGITDRAILMIYSRDRSRWEGIVMGLHAHRMNTSDHNEFTFERTGTNGQLELKSWFFRDWRNGIYFNYHERTMRAGAAKTSNPPATTVAQLDK
jgi:hypothetical protein